MRRSHRDIQPNLDDVMFPECKRRRNAVQKNVMAFSFVAVSRKGPALPSSLIQSSNLL